MLSFCLLRQLRKIWSPVRILPVSALLALLVVPEIVTAVDVTPLAPIPDPTPWTHQYQVRQSRIHEAETKARLMAKGLKRSGDKKLTATPNMDLYDVHYYDLVLELKPAFLLLEGLVTVRAEVTGTSISTLDLNLLGLTVSQTWTDGVTVPFAHVGEILTVTLDRTYVRGEEVAVQVAYSGNPSGNYFGWSIYGGKPMIWTLSEPYGAREWWPCKDLNTDKADSVDITVTVPDNLVVASNGLMVGQTVPSVGKKTFF